MKQHQSIINVTTTERHAIRLPLRVAASVAASVDASAPAFYASAMRDNGGNKK